jgi:hypothetical protein
MQHPSCTTTAFTLLEAEGDTKGARVGAVPQVLHFWQGVGWVHTLTTSLIKIQLTFTLTFSEESMHANSRKNARASRNRRSPKLLIPLFYEALTPYIFLGLKAQDIPPTWRYLLTSRRAHGARDPNLRSSFLGVYRDRNWVRQFS